MAFSKITRALTVLNDGWGAFNTLIDDLLATDNGKGASQIGVEDSAGNLTAENVEDAISEIFTTHSTTKTLAETFDENSATTTGLTWGYKGGLFRLNSTVTNVTASTIGLTDDSDNYIEIDPSDGLVKKNTTAFTSGRIPIRLVTTVGGSQTVSTDKRAWFSQVAAATATTSGIVELATDAETVLGSSGTHVITPSSLVAKMAAPGAIGGTTPSTAAFTDIDIDSIIYNTAGSSVTAAEIGYLDTATSGGYTTATAQFATKQDTITGAATTVVSADLTGSRVVVTTASGKLSASTTITTTELGYLNGCTAGGYTTAASQFATKTGITYDSTEETTSGSSIDFTGIPETVLRITVILSGVSTNGTGALQLRLGDSGGVETTNYLGSSENYNTTLAISTGFDLFINIAASSVLHGSVVLNRLNTSSKTWIANGIIARSDGGGITNVAGAKVLSDNLTRVQIVTANTFDAGYVNISYE